jgi:hypothetical protein
MLHRFSWGMFVFIGGLGTLMSLRGLADPASFLALFDAMGPSTAPLAAPEGAELARFLGRWIAIALLGGNVLTVGIAVTALRRGERWACWLMLYWPLMFATHFVMYEPGPMRTMQIAWLLVSASALAVAFTRRR